MRRLDRLALALALAAGCVVVRAPDDRAPEVCDNGVDDDFDGDLDCADADCDARCDQDGDGFAGAVLGGDDCDDSDADIYPGAPEDCGDGVDQDCDLDVDCDDADCGSELACLPCAERLLPPGAPQTVSGTTGDGANALSGSCGGGAAPEDAWLWAPTAAGTYTFDTAGTGFDTVLYVLDGCAGAELACNDDGVGLQSQVTVTLAEGQPVRIVVDGYDTASGSYTLNIY